MLILIDEKIAEIAILHSVVFALGAQEALATGNGFRATVDEILPINDFSANEIFDKVGMNDAGGLRGFGTSREGPGTSFVGASGKKAFEAKELVGSTDELSEARFS